MSRRLRVAVVGLGVGRAHVEAYKALPAQYELGVVCDLDTARAERVATEFGIPESTPRIDDVLARDDIDLVDLCTPPNSHCGLIEQSLRAGKHVICEKPLVGSLAEMDRILRAEKSAATSVFPIFQYRFGHGIQMLKHLQGKGFAHTLFLATIETLWRRDADYYDVGWRGKWATEMGGCCLTQALHAHDLLTYVNGPIDHVFAHLATRVNPIEVEDCAAVSVSMASGAVATLSATLGAADNTSRLRFMFSDLTAESRSTDPYRPGKAPWLFTGKTPELDAAIASALSDFVPGNESFAGQFERIHAALTEAAPSPVTLGEARASLELITAIYHSADTGTAVSLPIGADHPKYNNWTPSRGGFKR